VEEKMKIAVGILLALVVFVLGMLVGNKIAVTKNSSEIAKLRGETLVYKSESERLAHVIRSIQQTAAVAEKPTK
jgi:hypothetical protein